MSYWVYVLLNPEGKTYIGQTNDLPRRVHQHNDPEFHGTLHTKRHPGPWQVVYQEEHASRGEAMRRERELKSGGGRAWVREQLGQGDAGGGRGTQAAGLEPGIRRPAD